MEPPNIVAYASQNVHVCSALVTCLRPPHPKRPSRPQDSMNQPVMDLLSRDSLVRKALHKGAMRVPMNQMGLNVEQFCLDWSRLL